MQGPKPQTESAPSSPPFLSEWLPRGRGRLGAHRILMLRALVHEHEPWWRADELREVQRVLAVMAERPRHEVLQATPFFWCELERLWVALAYEQRPTAAALARLHVLAFDSLPEVVGETQVRGWEDGAVVLPRCGVELEDPGPHLRLEPLSILAKAHRVQVEGSAGGRVIASHSPALFDDGARTTIDAHADRQAFAAQVAAAHELIGCVRPRLLERLGEAIGWYVPLESPDPHTHLSFTLESQSGVMFLSPTDNEVRLAEAIVHELGHTELGHATLERALLVPEALALGDSLYSPWRPDPRPLMGLLHGLYVFCEVASFFECALARPELEPQHEWIAWRRTITLLRLRLGLAQVPRDALTDFGQRLLDRIAGYVTRYAPELRGAPPELRAAVAEHCSRWREANPGLCLIEPPLGSPSQESP